jgi:hypothetical protein
MQIALLKHIINDKIYDFHTLCNFIINKSLIEVVTHFHTDLYKYLNKIYLKKGFIALLNTKKLNSYILYIREKKNNNNKRLASICNITNKT